MRFDISSQNEDIKSLIEFTDDRFALSSDNTIKIWDMATNQCVTTLKVKNHCGKSLILFDDRRLAFSSSATSIKFWQRITYLLSRLLANQIFYFKNKYIICLCLTSFNSFYFLLERVFMFLNCF